MFSGFHDGDIYSSYISEYSSDARLSFRSANDAAQHAKS